MKFPKTYSQITKYRGTKKVYEDRQPYNADPFIVIWDTIIYNIYKYF